MLEFELVLPCYNEALSLENLIRRAVEAATSAGLTPKQFQLVLVENGSTDHSAEVLSILKKGPYGDWFRVVSLYPNEGYGNGIWQGLKTTTAAYIGWSHADQQCDLADPFRALKILKGETAPDMKILVKGHRFGRNWKDRCVSWVFQGLARLFLRGHFSEINAQPKVFPRSLLKGIDNPPKDFAFDLYILYRALKEEYLVISIPVAFPPRIHGVSRWAATFLGRYKTILKMIGTIWKLAWTEGKLG